MPRVYIHEVVEVDGTRRAHYQHHMTANWVPEGGPMRRQRCFGVFTLVGSTGAWPRVVNIWEYDGWDDLAHNFAVEFAGASHRDPMLEDWWQAAAEFRKGGFDRILEEHEANPGIEHWQARGGTSAVAYAHERFMVTTGRARLVADAVADGDSQYDRGSGLELVGLWRTAMRADDEVIAMWAVPDWETWASVEKRVALNWQQHTDVVALERTLLVDAELSPLRLGRQPEAGDRRPISEIG